jgi:hypothetical protein
MGAVTAGGPTQKTREQVDEVVREPGEHRQH